MPTMRGMSATLATSTTPMRVMRLGVAPPAKFWHPNHLGNLTIPTAHLPWGSQQKVRMVIKDVA